MVMQKNAQAQRNMLAYWAKAAIERFTSILQQEDLFSEFTEQVIFGPLNAWLLPHASYYYLANVFIGE